MKPTAETPASLLASRVPHHWNVTSARIPQMLIWKALVGLLAFDLLQFGHNFSRLYRYVRSVSNNSCKPLPETVDHVCTAVNFACVWYPKRVLCLQRSVITTCLLRHCGVAATMVMGSQTLPFKAHAWTEVDGHPVNERRNVLDIYQVWERC
jgi:Transglutaminase-like superfamily